MLGRDTQRLFLIALDANSTIQDSDIQRLLSATGWVNLIRDLSNATFIGPTTIHAKLPEHCIDYMIGSPQLLHYVQASGYLSFFSALDSDRIVLVTLILIFMLL